MINDFKRDSHGWTLHKIDGETDNHMTMSTDILLSIIVSLILSFKKRCVLAVGTM